ncbi:MAG: (d)CMP kinase [Myxococcales bacterium]|nr:(d)CMP kinase [Myxococcales bacterium]
MARAKPVIAIDGPAGAGKSTVAHRVAQTLDFVLVDTGALYRGVALAAREAAVEWSDGPGLARLTQGLDFAFASDARGVPRLLIDGVDRADEIRTPEISMGASHVSKHPEVRAALLDLQRRLGCEGGVVLEGRDIGTVVFPDAEAKVFLTADPRTRAQRRVSDLRGRGLEADLESTLREVRERDQQDSHRPVAPLKPALDAIELDSSGMTIDQVVETIVELVRKLGTS